MSFAFDWPVSPCAQVRRLRTAVLAAGAVGALLAGYYTGLRWGVWPAVGFGVASGAGLMAAWWLSGAPRAVGILSVDTEGSARWQPAFSAASAPFQPLRWQALWGVLCMEGLAGGHRLVLMSGSSRPNDDEDSVARIRAWMRWLDRGGATRQSPRA